MGPKLLQKRISNLHHKLLVNRLRAADAKSHTDGLSAGGKGLGVVDRRWEKTNYTWNVDDEEEIPGTVRILLSSGDPQRTKNQVVFSIPDRCYIPATPISNAIELFDQCSSSVYEEPEHEPPAQQAENASKSRPEATLPDDGQDTDANNEGDADHVPDALTAAAPAGSLDTARSDGPLITDRDDDQQASHTPGKAPKRKGAKGINHFSFCDRATQTTIPPIRLQGIQTEAPPRVSFGVLSNAWIIHDAYSQDLSAQQQKLQQQLAQENKAGANASSTSTATGSASTAEQQQQTAPVSAATFLLPPTGETVLSVAAVGRLDVSAHVIERMLNQNSYDEIAQDFKYWEDAADEFREPEGTLMPLWRFSPPAVLLRMFEENGSVRSQVPSHVTSICWNPHYKDLFAMGLGSRDNMSAESGLVCVFSLKSPTNPERFAQLQAGVSSLDFHSEFWQLLAVGMHDGHVAVIDLAVRKDPETNNMSNLLVYRSSAMRGKRTVPVTQVSWHGDTSDGNLRLFSISMDGCLCLWLFVQGELYPTELITLPFQGDNRLFDGNMSTLALSASSSCMAIHPSHTMVLVGTDQGQLWPVSNEGEILSWGPITAHQGPVYSIEWNPFHPDVFLTCGTDWLVKIWDRREREALVVINMGSGAEDCAFSPFSSTAFACMSDNGKVSIYDLNICLHKPLCCQRVAPQRRAQPTRIRFAPFHPVILVGDDKGHATCLKLSPNLRKVSRVPDSSRPVEVETEKLERVITLMKK